MESRLRRGGQKGRKSQLRKAAEEFIGISEDKFGRHPTSHRSEASAAIVHPDHLFSAVNFFGRLPTIFLNKCPFHFSESFAVDSLISNDLNEDEQGKRNGKNKS